MALCIHCNTEHPPDQTANPHYCIARLQESNEALEQENAKLREQVADCESAIKLVDAQYAKLRAELEVKTKHVEFYEHVTATRIEEVFEPLSDEPFCQGGHTTETDGSVTVHPPEKRDPKWNPDKYRLTKSPEEE